jgi:hypothetical protein
MSLRLDFCSRQAASFAVKAWHYSRSMPSGRLICLGVWEFDRYIGCLVFGRGASSQIASPFGLRQEQICELCRIALSPHQAPVSRILSIAIRLLQKQSPNLSAVVSYSDQRRGHDGRGVYGACGWTYLGETAREATLWVRGREVHARTVSSKHGTRDLGWLRANVDPQARRPCPR